MKNIISYWLSFSRTAHYATGLKLSRALLLWSMTSGLHLIGAHIEYAANGYTFVGWLMLFNALAPAVALGVVAYRQRKNIKE